ncbi:MAG TPA: cytochrome C [Crocinitomix sp.]|nr:cytochrome C [Crocinitomix sp.]
MKYFILLTIVFFILTSCSDNKPHNDVSNIVKTESKQEVNFDKRTSLKLNAKQKNHQLKNMRSHLIAIQSIIDLLADGNYDDASTVAYTQLGSTTEMKLMCASFGNEQFENLGLEFHQSADEMSEIFKEKNHKKSLKALSHTMDYCIRCHETFKQ